MLLCSCNIRPTFHLIPLWSWRRRERVAVRFWGKNFRIFSLPNRFNILRNAGENNTQHNRKEEEISSPFLCWRRNQKSREKRRRRRNFAVCSVWWWLAWLVGDPSWRWRPMIANGHPISSWPRNKYSWSLSLSLSLCVYIVYIHTSTLCWKRVPEAFWFFSLFSSFCRIWRRGGKRKFFNTCFLPSCLEFG